MMTTRNDAYKVAVVDDDHSLRQLTSLMLEQVGFIVLEYDSGDDFYRRYINDEPDMALLDVIMPGASGHTVCRKIMEQDPDTYMPIIIMTADDSLDSIDAAFECGATDFFPKPLNFPLLIQRIRYALRNADAWRLQSAYQQQMLQSEKMASLGQLAAGVAHEINNPVGYVSSNIQMLDDFTQRIALYVQGLDSLMTDVNAGPDWRIKAAELRNQHQLDFVLSELPGMLSDIDEGINRVDEIVRSLKSYAHPEEEALKPTDLVDLVLSVRKLIVGDLKYKAELTVEVPDHEVWIEANSTTLHQVLMNLLVNAFQSIDHDNGQVNLAVSVPSEDVMVEVRDNGTGIDNNELQQIFDPFYTTKPAGEGTGLGLSVSKAIMEKHGGSIQVESTPGRGSCFLLTFPLIDAKTKI